jgi:hypothetical protein
MKIRRPLVHRLPHELIEWDSVSSNLLVYYTTLITLAISLTDVGVGDRLEKINVLPDIQDTAIIRPPEAHSRMKCEHISTPVFLPATDALLTTNSYFSSTIKVRIF